MTRQIEIAATSEEFIKFGRHLEQGGGPDFEIFLETLKEAVADYRAGERLPKPLTMLKGLDEPTTT